MSEQIPTICRLVKYRLSADDVAVITRRRTTGKAIADRIATAQWPLGAQAHIGNPVSEGDELPMLIVKTWGDTPTSSVNGQVFLDGCDVLWVTSVTVGTGPRTYSWPTR